MATGKGKGVKWTGDTYEALAIALWRMHGTVTPEQQDAVAKDMGDNGFPVSWDGIRQHLQKLKKKDGDKKEGAAPATPPKKKTSNAPIPRIKKLATPGQNKRKMIAVDEDEDEDQVDKKKLKLEAQAPNFGQYHEDEPSPPSDGEV